jgi:hypothetical protein
VRFFLTIFLTLWLRFGFARFTVFKALPGTLRIFNEEKVSVFIEVGCPPLGGGDWL